MDTELLQHIFLFTGFSRKRRDWGDGLEKGEMSEEASEPTAAILLVTHKPPMILGITGYP